MLVATTLLSNSLRSNSFIWFTVPRGTKIVYFGRRFFSLLETEPRELQIRIVELTERLTHRRQPHATNPVNRIRRTASGVAVRGASRA
jgi:hypothetical protein